MTTIKHSGTLEMLMKYKIWADDITYKCILELPNHELIKVRETHFKTIIHTLNHIYVIEDIFKAHLTNSTHGYSARNTETTPSINELWQNVQKMNDWYLNLIYTLSTEELSEIIDFEFVDGGKGSMSREEIILHIINHATYHRGFVSDLLYQTPASMPANDLPVYLRDNIDR